MKKIDEYVKIFDFSIFGSSKKRLLKMLSDHLETDSGLKKIFTPNPEQIMLSRRDKNFASYLGLADILIPDGGGLRSASKIISIFTGESVIQERIAGADLAEDLIELAAAKNQQVLLLGGRGYDAEAAGKGVVKLNHNGAGIYWLEGYQDITSPTQEEEQHVIKAIETLKPTIVFAAFGAPHQEKWVIEHQEILEKNQVKIAMVVGGAFDMILGRSKRAPAIIRNLGFEWLYRLVREPWRAGRQLQLLAFIGLTLKTALSSANSTHRRE